MRADETWRCSHSETKLPNSLGRILLSGNIWSFKTAKTSSSKSLNLSSLWLTFGKSKNLAHLPEIKACLRSFSDLRSDVLYEMCLSRCIRIIPARIAFQEMLCTFLYTTTRSSSTTNRKLAARCLSVRHWSCRVPWGRGRRFDLQRCLEMSAFQLIGDKKVPTCAKLTGRIVFAKHLESEIPRT